MSVAGCELPLSLRAQIATWAEAAFPDEACGVLIGRVSASTASVQQVTSAVNLNRERSTDRYLLDPADFRRADAAAAAVGLEVIGFWHSHPDHPAWPSQFDSDHAWTDYVYLIVNVQAGKTGAINAFGLGETELEPIGLTVTEPAAS